MEFKKHGLSIGIERIGSKFFLALRISGKLTHDDYRIITPMIDSALDGVQHPEINALVIGTEFEGWDLRAAWDDFKLGLKHGREFHKVAIVGNRKWQEHVAKIGSWFVSGEVRYFDDEVEAVEWLHS